MSKVSVVLPTYNGSQYIRESIDSVMKQSYSDIELIIVNDCSTDDTLEIIDNYIYDHSEFADKIRVINNEVNKKLPASLNRGFEYATGEYWTWTSDDNYYDENAIAIMVDFLQQHTDIGLIYCDSRLIDSQGNTIKDNHLPEPGMIWKANVVGACFLYRAECAKKVGEYSTDRFLTEDYEYWIRMSLVTKLYHLKKVLYNYRIHESSLSATRLQDIIRETTRLRLDYIDYFESFFKGVKKRKLYNSILNSASENDYDSIKGQLIKHVKWFGVYRFLCDLKDK